MKKTVVFVIVLILIGISANNLFVAGSDAVEVKETMDRRALSKDLKSATRACKEGLMLCPDAMSRFEAVICLREKYDEVSDKCQSELDAIEHIDLSDIE